MSSPKIYIVQPDEATRNFIVEKISTFLPDAELNLITNAEDLNNFRNNVSEVDFLFTEIYIEETNGIEFLYEFRLKFPKTPILIASIYELEEYMPYLEGFPLVTLPCEDGVLDVLCSSLLPSLEGFSSPPFQIETFRGGDNWGQFYEANQSGVQRKVELWILPSNVSESVAERFQMRASTMAKASHPNVTSVYQVVEIFCRPALVCELWSAPSLEEMAESSQKITPRTLGRIVSTTAQVITFWQQNSLKHPPITGSLVTLASNGVIKLKNCVDGEIVSTSGTASLEFLAKSCRKIIDTNDSDITLANQLLEMMESPSADIFKIISLAQKFEITESNSESLIEVPQEHIETEKAVAKAKHNNQLVIVAVTAFFVILSLLLSWKFLLKDYFFDSTKKSKEFALMLKIPAGEFVYQDGKKSTTQEFYIDEYEVTIGQYLKFLKAIKTPEDAEKYAEVDDPEKDFSPRDWVNIIESIKRDLPYQGQKLSMDSPIFNVDWYDAYAYAKWANKRLPTEIEWEKAARGVKGNLYPWGNEPSFTRANTGVDYTAVNPKGGGKKDGYVGVSPVDAKLEDISVFGVRSMAGNVSEWTDSWDNNSKLGAMLVPVIRGGNYQKNNCKLTQRGRDKVAEGYYSFVGFRCARDSAPASSANASASSASASLPPETPAKKQNTSVSTSSTSTSSASLSNASLSKSSHSVKSSE